MKQSIDGRRSDRKSAFGLPADHSRPYRSHHRLPRRKATGLIRVTLPGAVSVPAPGEQKGRIGVGACGGSLEDLSNHPVSFAGAIASRQERCSGMWEKAFHYQRPQRVTVPQLAPQGVHRSKGSLARRGLPRVLWCALC